MVDQRIAYRARGVPEVQPAPQRGSLESLGDEIGLWIEATSDAVAEAMMEGDRAPFSARVSQARLAEYYGSQLWDQNGNPNPQLWRREYQRVGADGLREAIDGGARWRRANGLPVVLPPPTALGAQPTPSPDEPLEQPEETPAEEGLGGRQPARY